jgi:hypothetical protein
MIRVNALFFLLLVELLVIFAGLIVFLVVRGKRHLVACRESKKALDSAHAAQEELRKQVMTLKTGAAQQSSTKEGATAKTQSAPKTETKDLEACKMEIAGLEEKLTEKTKLLIDLQAKFDSVEKEYLFLYQQQQQAQEMNKS